MAFYKNPKYLQQSDDAAFDTLHQPGAAPPYSGIYRCEGCGREITHIGNTSLPPQNHHQHNPQHGPIRWRLIVAHAA